MRNDRVIYRNLEHPDIYDGMVYLMEKTDAGQMADGDEERLYTVVNGLVELAGAHGFRGNIWHSYLAYELANHENNAKLLQKMSIFDIIYIWKIKKTILKQKKIDLNVLAVEQI